MNGDLYLDLMNDVQEQAFLACKDLIQAMVDSQVGSDGNVYGNRDIGRGGRIARFVDDANTGALDMLKTVSPPVYQKYVSEFIDDYAHSPAVEPGAVTDPSQNRALVHALYLMRQGGQ